MPNGKHKWAPQIVGTKPRANMNAVDREGVGPWIIQYKHENPTKGYRKISDALLEEHGIYVSWQSIAMYIQTFRDPNTGALCPIEALPNIPDKFNTIAIAQDLHTRLEDSQMEDLNILENLAQSEMAWFQDPHLPIPLKLKVAKELRETLKLKFEMGGLVKAPTTINNNLNIDTNEMQKILDARPDSVGLLRDLFYLSHNTQVQSSEPEAETIDITPVGDEDGS